MREIKSNKAPEPVGLYPHARRVGDFLFLSGIGPRKRGERDIPGVTLDVNGSIISYSIEKQCHSVFANVKTVLQDAGSSWDKLVDITVFLTNMQKDFPTYNRIYGEYFGQSNPRPCRTTVEIVALPTPIAIELKCIATI